VEILQEKLKCEWCGLDYLPTRFPQKYCSRRCYFEWRERISVEERFWKYVDVRGPGECWPWTGTKDRNGYGRLYVHGIPELASRISFRIHKGPLPEGLEACHSCDNPPCVNPTHLFQGTHKQNFTDAVTKNRIRHGENHPFSKLTQDTVRVIRSMPFEIISQREVAELLGCSESTISEARSGKNWK